MASGTDAADELPMVTMTGETVTVSGSLRWRSIESVPLAMEALLESGEAHAGQNALIVGFGAGLVFGGQVVTLP